MLLKTLHYIFAAISLSFAVYGLVTNDHQFQPMMLLFMGLMLFIMGLESFKEGRKVVGWFLIAVFLFSLIVSVQGFSLY